MPAKTVQLRLGGEDAEDELLADLRELEVEERADGPTTFRLVLSLARSDEGAWSHVDDDRFAPFSRVDVGLGMGAAGAQLPGAAGVESLVEGYVSDVAIEIGEAPADAVLQVTGLDATLLMDVEEKVTAWPNVTDAQAVEQIHGGYGLLVDATATQPMRQDNETTMIQRSSDAAFVRTLARRNGFEWALRPGPGGVRARFGPPQLGGSPQPELAARFGDDTTLRSLSVGLSGTRPLVVSATQLDARTKSDATAQVDSASLPLLGRTGSEDVAAPLGRLVTAQQANGLMLLTPQPTADTSELQAIAQAVRDEAAWLTTAEGEIDTDAYGHVLRAGRTVLVKGAGDAHSGTYYVTRVRHRFLTGGEYHQSFTARRNARDVEGAESFGDGLLQALAEIA